MNGKTTLFLTSLLATLLTWNVALAIVVTGVQNINLAACDLGTTDGMQSGDTLNQQIQVLGSPGKVNWSIAPGAGCTPPSGGVSSCINGKIAVTVPTGPVAPSVLVTLTGGPIADTDKFAQGQFTLTVASVDDPSKTCSPTYVLHVNSPGGSGWGDPHMTTVDAVHYDFQGAGEYTVLRGDGFEVQTRQWPVPSTGVPGPSDYTGISSCVAIYTAVAVRIGSNRVTYEPNLSGQPDPSGMQLRVNGQLVTIPEQGIDLVSGGGGPGEIAAKAGASAGKAGVGGKAAVAAARAGAVAGKAARAGKTAIANASTGTAGTVEGHIANAATGGGAIEITSTYGTRVVVTPAYWPDQQTWYLNVNVYNTAATQGIMGRLASDSWLPALPDGTSVGGKPDAVHDRYQALYAKFGDAWRVTDATSLFDYASGTSTATFTRAEWPRESPKSCTLEGRTPVTPVELPVAQKACSLVIDKTQKADCIFDVSVTGNTDFGKSYGVMQQLVPGATTVTLKGDKDPTKKGESVTFTASAAEAAPRGQGIPTGTVQFTVDGQSAGPPATLDATGKALLATADLSVGKHEIVAQYLPAQNIVFLTSTSAPESHTVVGSNLLWWILLLIILLIVIILIVRSRGK